MSEEWEPPRRDSQGRVVVYSWQPIRAALEATYKALGLIAPKNAVSTEEHWNVVATAIDAHEFQNRPKCSHCRKQMQQYEVIRCLDCKAALCERCAPEHFWPNGNRQRVHPVASLSRLTNIKHVQQETDGGCVIASLAMLAGMSFKEVLAEYPWSEGGCDMELVSEDFCYRHGFARARIYQWHPGPAVRDDQDHKAEYEKRRRTPWPPIPFAPAHLCMVKTSQYHCVVMLADGTVLDPLTPEPKRLSDYSETTQVHGIWDVL